MMWNGTDITRIPTFIYHDELLTGTGPISFFVPGTLVCYSTNMIRIEWEFVENGHYVSTSTTGENQNFFQRITVGTIASFSRLSTLGSITTPSTDPALNGLWRCGPDGGPTLHVGLYGRVQGK